MFDGVLGPAAAQFQASDAAALLRRGLGLGEGRLGVVQLLCCGGGGGLKGLLMTLNYAGEGGYCSAAALF